MAKKVYKNGGVVIIEDTILNTFQAIASNSLDFKQVGTIFYLRDGIENTSIELGIFSNILNESDVAFSSDTEFKDYISSLINSGNNSPTALSRSANQDISGSQAFNTVFGDAIQSTRVPSITAQFQYGLQGGNTNPVQDDAISVVANGLQ